jgi:hypothetical protein
VYSEAYFVGQWERQRECQLNAMVVENTDALSRKLAKLVGLEQSLQQSELRILNVVSSKQEYQK